MIDMPSGRPRRQSPKFKSLPKGRDVHVSEPILGYKTLWFTRHALERMKQRRVSEAEVFEVLRSPQRKGLPTQGKRDRWRRKRIAGPSVDVVFEKWPDKLCIITVIVVK